MDSDILKPIDGVSVSGADIRNTREFDALKEFRREDDKSLSYDVWARPLKIPNWDELHTNGQDLLINKTKDLQILIWFTETFKRDFDGLLRGLQLVNQFIQKFYATFYPQDDMTRISLLEWMERIYIERVLLISFGASDSLTLDQWRYSLFMQENQIEGLRKKLLLTTTEEIQKKKALVEDCLVNMRDIKAFLSEYLPDGPTFHDLIDALSQIEGVLDYRLEQAPLKEEAMVTETINMVNESAASSSNIHLTDTLKIGDVMKQLDLVYATLIQIDQGQVADVVKLANTMLQKYSAKNNQEKAVG